jgi:hypothetical protein
VVIKDYFSRDNELIADRIYPFPGAHYRYTVAALSIDAVFGSRPKPDYVIAKIDTEGSEVAVLSGASNSMAQCTFILLLEFWPWLRDRPIAGTTYKDFLIGNFDLFDINNACVPGLRRRIARAEFDSFADALEATKDCTDLICVPKKLGTRAHELFPMLYQQTA